MYSDYKNEEDEECIQLPLRNILIKMKLRMK